MAGDVRLTEDWERSYAAGLFEGEGSVIIKRQTKPKADRVSYGLSCEITMCDVEPLTFLSLRWGGKVNPLLYVREPRWRQPFRWSLASNTALPFLNDISPFVQMERMKAKIRVAFAFQAQKKNGRPKSGEGRNYVARQEQFYELMRSLNQRGEHSLFRGEDVQVDTDIDPAQFRLVG